MQFKFKHLQKIVGGFFLLAVVLIIVLLVLVARGQRWFQAAVPYHCFFDRTGGLAVGAGVTIRGLEAGKVRVVSLEPDNRIRVDIEIYRKYADRIRTKSLAKLLAPLVGSSSLEIAPGPQDVPLIPHEGTIPSKEEGAADLDQLIESATELIEQLEDPKGDLMETLASVNRITKKVADALEEKKGQPGMLDELASSISHLDNLLAMLDESSPDIQDSIVEARRALKEANKVIRAAQKSIFLRGHVERYLKEDTTLRTEGRAR